MKTTNGAQIEHTRQWKHEQRQPSNFGWRTNAPNSISPPLFMRKIHIVQTCTHFHRRRPYHFLLDWQWESSRTNNSLANKHEQANQTFGWVFKWNIFKWIPWRRRTNCRFSLLLPLFLSLSLHFSFIYRCIHYYIGFARSQFPQSTCMSISFHFKWS